LKAGILSFVRPPVASRITVEGAGRKPGTSHLFGPAPPAHARGAHGRIWANGGRRNRRGGVRTSVLSVLTLAAVAAVVIIVLAGNLGPPEQVSAPNARPSPETSKPASASDGPEIAGTIAVAPDLMGRVQDGSVLFVIAHKGGGPPFAVKRIASPCFPLAYRLGPEDVMMAGSAFDGEVRLSARLSRTGAAGPAQPGDLEGEHAAQVRVGARNVDIVISRVR
jgi:cytochrome c-type biogenesis protein CcmH